MTDDLPNMPEVFGEELESFFIDRDPTGKKIIKIEMLFSNGRIFRVIGETLKLSLE